MLEGHLLARLAGLSRSGLLRNDLSQRVRSHPNTVASVGGMTDYGGQREAEGQ